MTTDAAAAPAQPVDDPTDLTRADYISALKRTIAEIKADDAPSLAAGVAFRMFLSLFPSLFAAVAVFSLVTSQSEIVDLIGRLSGVMPSGAIEVIRDPLRDLASTEEGTAGLAAVIGVLAGLFAATSAAVALMKALSRAYNVPETRKLMAARLTALVLVTALIVGLIALIVLMVAGPQLQDAVLPDFPGWIDFLLGVARLLLALGVLILLFAFVYWIGPNRERPSWAWMSPGALIGVLGWLAVSAGFTLYAQTAGSYDATYGTLAGVVVLLLWLQLSMLMILVGAEFNAEVERIRSTHLAVRAGAGFGLPAPAAVPPAGQDGGAAGAPSPPGKVEPRQVERSAAAPATATAPVAAGSGSGAGGSSPTRRKGVITAGLMTVAVFLGLARHRRRS